MNLESKESSDANNSKKSYDSLESVYETISKSFVELRKQVIRQPEGYIKYPYLTPAGFYTQLWDWDAFFMANHFMTKGSPEFMKSWVLIFSSGIDSDGYVAGCMTKDGPRNVYHGRFAMKPFLSQGAYQYSHFVENFEWIRPINDRIRKVIEFRRQNQFDAKSGLYFWEIAMQSGADNNPCLNFFKEDSRSFLSTDCSAFQYGEILSQASIERHLHNLDEFKKLTEEASKLKEKLNEICWNDNDFCYYNVDRETRKQYKRIGYSSFVPLMYKMAPYEKGREMIRRYLLNDDHLSSPFGFRSLSKSDVDYNNKNIIVPFSNWQGPVWCITNFIFSIVLFNYGFVDEIKSLALNIGKLLAKDLDQFGTMHENYSADNGEPLAPSNFKYKTADGKIQGFISWNLCIENVIEGCLQNNWMLLDIEGMDF